MHVQGHLRDAFAGWVDDGCTSQEVGADEFYEGARPVDWLFGQLWHCSDIMPWSLCDQLGMPPGSAYAKAVQHLSERDLDAQSRRHDRQHSRPS
jgi:hypothetical protein